MKSEIEEDLAGAANRDQLAGERGREIDFAAGLDGGEAAPEIDDAMATIDEGGRRRRAASGDDADHHAIAGGQGDVGNREGGRDGGLELTVALGEAHRSAGVDEDVGEEVFLFLEELDVELVGTAIEAPVDIAEVVAVGIVAEIVELEGGAAAWGQMIALAQARELAPRLDAQLVEASDELGGKFERAGRSIGSAGA